MNLLMSTYDSEHEPAVQEGASAADEGDEEEEAAGGHAEVAGPVVPLDGEVFRVNPEAGVAANPERHGE